MNTEVEYIMFCTLFGSHLVIILLNHFLLKFYKSYKKIDKLYTFDLEYVPFVCFIAFGVICSLISAMLLHDLLKSSHKYKPQFKD